MLIEYIFVFASFFVLTVKKISKKFILCLNSTQYRKSIVGFCRMIWGVFFGFIIFTLLQCLAENYLRNLNDPSQSKFFQFSKGIFTSNVTFKTSNLTYRSIKHSFHIIANALHNLSIVGRLEMCVLPQGLVDDFFVGIGLWLRGKVKMKIGFDFYIYKKWLEMSGWAYELMIITVHKIISFEKRWENLAFVFISFAWRDYISEEEFLSSAEYNKSFTRFIILNKK